MYDVRGEKCDEMWMAVRETVHVTCMWRNMDVRHKQHKRIQHGYSSPLKEAMPQFLDFSGIMYV